MKNQKEQNKIHAQIKVSQDTALSQSETKDQLTALFSLLLEMHIDQTNNVTKEYESAKQPE